MTDENIVQTQPWHSMYIGVSSILLGNDIVHKVEPETKETIATNEHNTIGVSSILLGNDVAHKVETEETKVTDQHNTINKNDDKKNQSDSTSSTNDATSHSVPSIPSTATTNPSLPTDTNNNIQDKDIQLQNDKLRSQVLLYQNNASRTTKQRRMSTLDHEVLHSALTCEIQSLTKQLEQEKIIKTKMQETFNTVSIDHQAQTEHIAHLLELVKASENEKQHLKREIDLMEETIIDYENQIEEMVQDKKTDDTACSCGCLSTSGSKGNTNKGRAKHKRNSAKPKRRKSKQGFDGFDNEME
jgi:hypothetical protein